MKAMFRLFVFSFVLMIAPFAAPVPAWPQESLEHLPVPRWAALASAEANLRTGPGKRYPIDWVLAKKSLPVEIIQEFEHWRRVREPGGADGWVHKSMLTGMRKVLLQKDQTLYAGPSDHDRVIATLQKGVIASLAQCQKDWCAVEAEHFDGWTVKDNLWGVYKDEVFGD